MAAKYAAKVGEDITGKEKYDIMRKAISQYNLAMEQGFFLEATTLAESLIANRMESRLAELKNDYAPMKPLGELSNMLDAKEEDKQLITIMKEIRDWAKMRNNVIHQAAKIEKGEEKSWEDFLELAKKTAGEGRDIFDWYNSRLYEIRKN